MSKARDHAATIEAAIARDEAARLPLVASWQRSSLLHSLNPEKNSPSERLTTQEFAVAQERLGGLLHASAPNLDQLYLAVKDMDCSVILADRNGVAISRRCAGRNDDIFNDGGLCAGAVWSEESEGTNGVGTCIVEHRPLTIHASEHFHTKNTALTCTAAPIFDHHGNLMAVVDVSSCFTDLTEGLSRLISMAVINTARQIETDHFRARFTGACIVLASRAELDTTKGAALIAVDQDDLVIGATRYARSLYGLNDTELATPKPLSSLQGHQVDQAYEYANAEHRIIQQAMANTGGNVSAAARELRISRATLHRKLKKFSGRA